MEAKFSQSGNDIYWTHFDMEDGTIRWTGYDDDYWWSNVSKQKSFTHKTGSKTGRIFILDPETGNIKVDKQP